MILTIKTDQPLAKLALFESSEQLDQLEWQAHRELAMTILTKLTELIERNDSGFEALRAIVVYQGPGSFTGLRIGATVANTLAYSLDIPVVGTGGNNWQLDGLGRITDGENDRIVQPVYGSEANITTPRK